MPVSKGLTLPGLDGRTPAAHRPTGSCCEIAVLRNEMLRDPGRLEEWAASGSATLRLQAGRTLAASLAPVNLVMPDRLVKALDGDRAPVGETDLLAAAEIVYA